MKASTTPACSAGSDYTTLGDAIITFNPGQTSQPVAVEVLGDAVVERDETFFLNLSAAVTAVTVDAQVLGTIINDDVAAPDLNVTPGSLAFGNQGSGSPPPSSR